MGKYFASKYKCTLNVRFFYRFKREAEILNSCESVMGESFAHKILHTCTHVKPLKVKIEFRIYQ